MNPWTVEETLCFPKKWKVYPKHTYKNTNNFDNFFEHCKDAESEANIRNKEHEKKNIKETEMSEKSRRTNEKDN